MSRLCWFEPAGDLVLEALGDMIRHQRQWAEEMAEAEAAQRRDELELRRLQQQVQQLRERNRLLLEELEGETTTLDEHLGQSLEAARVASQQDESAMSDDGE